MATNESEPKTKPKTSDREQSCAEKAAGEGVHVGPDTRHATLTDFSGLVLSLAEAAMIEMGLKPGPGSQEVTRDFKMAQQTIDILHMLKDKTTGNLTKDESRLLDGVLYQLHLCFVEARSKA